MSFLANGVSPHRQVVWSASLQKKLLSAEGKYLYIDSLFSEIILHHRIRRAPSPFWQRICDFDARVRNGEVITEEETKE